MTIFSSKSLNEIAAQAPSSIQVEMRSFLSEEQISRLEAYLDLMKNTMGNSNIYRDTKQMLDLADTFLSWLSGGDGRLNTSISHKEQFMICVWLHHVGELLLPLDALDKATRLGHHGKTVVFRHRMMRLQNRIDLLEGLISIEEYEAILRQLKIGEKIISQMNNAPVIDMEQLETLVDLNGILFHCCDGEFLPLLTEEEFDLLTKTMSSEDKLLYDLERYYVMMVEKLLEKLGNREEYFEAACWLALKHRILCGGGWVRRELIGVPKEADLLVILELFVFLTSHHRCAHPDVTIQAAFDVMESLAADRLLDEAMLMMFKRSCVWKAVNALDC